MFLCSVCHKGPKGAHPVGFWPCGDLKPQLHKWKERACELMFTNITWFQWTKWYRAYLRYFVLSLSLSEKSYLSGVSFSREQRSSSPAWEGIGFGVSHFSCHQLKSCDATKLEKTSSKIFMFLPSCHAHCSAPNRMDHQINALTGQPQKASHTDGTCHDSERNL